MNYADTRNPDKERELELVNSLYKKGYTHLDIATCLQRGRKIFKWEPTDITNCIKVVQNILLDLYRRKDDGHGVETIDREKGFKKSSKADGESHP